VTDRAGPPDRDRAEPSDRDRAEQLDRDRDRDGHARPRNARPRDGLGRPLPYGAAGVERAPEGVVRTPAETLREAQRLLDAGLPFHAHEVLEDAWKSAPDSERELWRGLAQLAVGVTHAARGNRRGTEALLRRGARAIEPFSRAAPHGLDLTAVLRWAEHARAVVEHVDQGVPTRLPSPPLHP
jgi:hypothetical protein